MAFPNTERSGKVAHVRYRGGVQGRPPEDVCWEEPTTIRMGVGEVIRGIDEALYDMQVGETRTVVLPPEKAYGEHDPAVVQTSETAVSQPDNDRRGTFVWSLPRPASNFEPSFALTPPGIGRRVGCS